MSGIDALKQWLLGKVHGLLGVKRLQLQLAQIGEQLQAIARSNEWQGAPAKNMQAAAEAMLGAFASSAVPESTALDLEELRSLESQGLFLIGCARSGTTILTRSLNRSPDILLLEEPNLYLHEHITDFVDFFNKLHASMSNRRMKGTYLAAPLTPESGTLATLARLRRQYRYLGEKIAVGPHDYPPDWMQRCLDFQAKYFLRARYLYILRTPTEAVWSMHKKFPDRPVWRLFEAWLYASALAIHAYHVFPNSRVVFFEDLGEPMLQRLADWLEAPIPLVPGTFGREYMNSALTRGSIPEPLADYANLCRECTAIYRGLCESFSKEDLVYCGTTSEWRYFDSVLDGVQGLIDKLHRSKAEATRPLRIAG